MIGNIKTFRFWCQKVIPLVYDNSLSYYEVLCKVVHYLNSVIEDINEIPEYIDEKIKEAITNEHIRELISEVFRTLEDAISKNNEEENTHFSKDYPVLGTTLWHDNKFYRTIRAIDQGDAILVGVNIELVDFATLFDEFIDEVKENFTPYDDGLRETASEDRTVNTLVWLDDTLYEVIKPITQGNAYLFEGDNQNVQEITMDGLYKYILELISNEASTRASEDNRITLELSDLIASEGARITLELSDLITSKVGIEASAREAADDELRALIESTKSYYDTVAEMVADETILPNTDVVVLGYHACGDCDYMIYHISTESVAGIDEINLDNGLYAKLVRQDEKIYNVKQLGAYGDGVHNDYAIINGAINTAREYDDCVVYLPAGEYIINIYLSALRTSSITNVYRDFHNLTIKGDGEQTIIHGKSSTQIFDILQINEGANLNIKDLALTETTTATGVTHGANGISLTNGCKNITVENVTVYNLPYYTGNGYVDGGKAFTVQNDNDNTNDVCNITFSNCKCHDVPIGYEWDSVANSDIKFFNHVIKDCEFDVTYTGIVTSTPTWGSGQYALKCDFKFINNKIRSRQRCVNVSRGSGEKFELCTFEQYGTKESVLPSDTSSNSMMIYSARDVIVDKCVFISSFGDTAIHVSNDNSTRSEVVLQNSTCAQTFTIAMVGSSGSVDNEIVSQNLINIGATTTYTTNARLHSKIALNYGNYNIFNSYLMTNKHVAHTVGVGTGHCIPIYNPEGSLYGYIPIYT